MAGIPSNPFIHEEPLISRIPSRYLRTQGVLSVEQAWKVYSAGSVPVSILSFFPELAAVEQWVAKWVNKVLPSGIKTRLMQRELLSLSKLYSGLSDEDRECMSAVVDTDKIIAKIYEAASLSFPRTIRLLAHMLLDQLLWCHSSEKGKNINAVLYPKDDTAMEFQLSRIDYLLATLGPLEACEKLNAAGQTWATIRVMLKHLDNPHYSVPFSLIDQTCSMIECLQPRECLQLLAIHHTLPSRVRRTLFEHLHAELILIRKPKRLSAIVEKAIGQSSFIWCLLEPQSILADYLEWEGDDLAIVRRLSPKIFKHLQALDYPYLIRGGRRLVRYHPANGTSLIEFLDWVLVTDKVAPFQSVLERLTRTKELAAEIVAATSNSEHRDHTKATFIVSRIPRLQSTIGHMMLSLRIIASDLVLDEDIGLAIFEQVHDILYDANAGVTAGMFYSDIVNSIGFEKFLSVLLRPRRWSPVGHREEQSSVIDGCIQDFSERILVIVAGVASIEHVKMMQKACAGQISHQPTLAACHERLGGATEFSMGTIKSFLRRR